MLVSSSDSAPALVPVRMKPFRSRATTSASQSMQGSAPGEEQEREGHALAAPELECDRLELAIRAVQFSDLAPIANYHAVALEVASEVVRQSSRGGGDGGRAA